MEPVVVAYMGGAGDMEEEKPYRLGLPYPD